jgi:hypothetical protein
MWLENQLVLPTHILLLVIPPQFPFGETTPFLSLLFVLIFNYGQISITKHLSSPPFLRVKFSRIEYTSLLCKQPPSYLTSPVFLV